MNQQRPQNDDRRAERGGQMSWRSRTNPWIVFLLPFAVFMAVGSLEPPPMGVGALEDDLNRNWLGIHPHDYPLVYSLKIACTCAAIAWVWPGYRVFPWRVSPLAIVVGVVGIVAWVGICNLGLEKRLATILPALDKVFGLGQRSEFNPLDPGSGLQPIWAYVFLAIRLFGLAMVVPVLEEMFLRGFLMRYVVDPDFWKVPFGQATQAAIVAGTVFPMLMHPAELFAALVWFSLVTWLMLRTRNIWDCVVAHAVTNLLLGVWVLASGQWFLM